MLTRYEKRQEEARRLASTLLADYGYDRETASDRALAICNGQRWLERLVQREMFRMTSTQRKAA